MRKQARARDQWYNLDNAANIFPAVSNDRNTNVFRLSCELLENIDKLTLQQALDIAMKDFRHFQVVMRRGLFWFYLERTEIPPRVKFENERPCGRLFYKNIKELLFSVSYYRRRINLEVFHAVSDGGGAIRFLNAIVYHYILLRHPADFPVPPKLESLPVPALKTEDSFDRYYDPTEKQSPFLERAYTITGTVLPANSLSVISGSVSTKQMLALAKSKGCTATSYLTALLICAIYHELMPRRAGRRPVGVTIPVDLRGHFTSETTRNFFGVVEVRYNFHGGEADFDSVLAAVTSQLAEKVKPGPLSKRMNYTMGVQKNIFARFTPLILKNFVLRAAYHRSEHATTTALSNMGRVVVPEELSPYITGFSCLLNPTAIHRVKLCICSYQDHFVLNFTSCIAETGAQRYFFRHLAQNGADVCVTCNGGNGDEIL